MNKRGPPRFRLGYTLHRRIASALHPLPERVDWVLHRVASSRLEWRFTRTREVQTRSNFGPHLQPGTKCGVLIHRDGLAQYPQVVTVGAASTTAVGARGKARRASSWRRCSRSPC